MRDVENFQVSPKRLHSATHEEIIQGATTDIYFVKTAKSWLRSVFRNKGYGGDFPARAGVLAGVDEGLQLLAGGEWKCMPCRKGVPSRPGKW